VCDNCKNKKREIEYEAFHIIKKETVKLCAKCTERLIGLNTIKSVKGVQNVGKEINASN